MSNTSTSTSTRIAAVRYHIYWTPSASGWYISWWWVKFNDILVDSVAT